MQTKQLKQEIIEMNREESLAYLADKTRWDFVIIGGGATGVGCAVEAASRGYRTLLLEQNDFGAGTSSRSTKLVHGGVRYLQQGNVAFVLEALKERTILRQNAPHLVHNLPFIVPNYEWWEGPFYGVGLKLYDLLAGKHGFGPSKNLSRDETLALIPTLESSGLLGGVIYHDGQFDDARLIINMAQTAAEQGAVLANYVHVTGLKKENSFVSGVLARDVETGAEFEIDARAVINATGVFVDDIRRMDDPAVKPMIRPSQGIHIVLDKSFLPGESAIMVPHTDDGRVLFAVPWHDKVIVGTTDTPVDKAVLEPKPFEHEIEFLLKHAARYLVSDPDSGDILSVFAGLRPLVSLDDQTNTAALSRDHTIYIAQSGLVTIAGGKWTTYRKMAEDTIDHAIELTQLPAVDSVSKNLPIHGHIQDSRIFENLSVYGSDAQAVKRLVGEKPAYGERLHERFATVAGEVIWAVRHEMARTVQDFLSRRTRALILDARASMEAAPRTAELMAEELHKDRSWINQQVEDYNKLAAGYIV
jgi:glycerol-3-phosphate dehydrogenase